MILDKFRLDGKVALVTGSRRGLGHAMAVALAEAGADIVSFDRREPTKPESIVQYVGTKETVESIGRRHLWKKVDLLTTTYEELQRLVDEVIREWGHIDILVNNAGISPRDDLLEYSLKSWDETIKVNLSVPWYLAQIVARQMVKRGGGKIINIASLLSHQGGVKVPGYTASKHGVIGFTKAMSNELASKRVNVNSITPGYMDTDLVHPVITNPRDFGIDGRVPADRWGKPEDLQGACLLLASKAGDYINGADIPVDGGWLAW